MNKQGIYNIVDEIEKEQGEVQRAYFKHERHAPERLENLGLDNFSGNGSLYYFCCSIEEGDMTRAKADLDEVADYIEHCFGVVDAYKPIAICTWRGLDADIWPSLVKIKAKIQDLQSML